MNKSTTFQEEQKKVKLLHCNTNTVIIRRCNRELKSRKLNNCARQTAFEPERK